MIYDYILTTGKGEKLKLSDYMGKVILVVNTATCCGFTPQYTPIEQLYRDHHDQGLEILDIPFNQFGGQAPETDEEIHEFCTTHFNTTFPQMKKRMRLTASKRCYKKSPGHIRETLLCVQVNSYS